MKESFYIALRYLLYHRSRTLILVTCITLIIYLPTALQIFLDKSEQLLKSRAANTSLILGKRGSQLDLVLNTLYFQGDEPEIIDHAAVDEIYDSELAVAIPMYVRFSARDHMIVGTTVDYFSYRNLTVDRGVLFRMLGECVIGANVARDLDLNPGDHIVSTSENVFDIAGVYPLKMRVSGVLKEAGNSDDDAIFTDVKTTWVIQGLVHGHQDLSETQDPSLLLSSDSTHISASPKLYEYNEVTEENVDSFHFHGDMSDYPVSSVIVIPDSQKASTLLQGRFLQDTESPYQLVQPEKTIEELLSTIFKIKDLIDMVLIFVACSTFLALVLVFSLSMKLRSGEMHTYTMMGGSKYLIIKLFVSEISLILAMALFLNTVLYFMTLQISDSNAIILLLNL